MRTLLAALLPAALVACAPGEPEAPLPLVEPSGVEELLLSSGSVVLAVLEKCKNNVDDDGDGLVDGNDPDCKGKTIGGNGIAGDVQEGTGIVPVPEMQFLKASEGELGIQYDERGTAGLKEYALLTLVVNDGREKLASYVTLYDGAVTSATPIVLEGDKATSLMFEVKTERGEFAFLAVGPLGNNVYTDQGAISGKSEKR